MIMIFESRRSETLNQIPSLMDEVSVSDSWGSDYWP